MNNTDVFQTSDFDLATFLYAKGIILQGIADNPDNHRRKVFVFEEPPSDLLSQFQSGTAEANLLAITKAQNALRGFLRGE